MKTVSVEDLFRNKDNIFPIQSEMYRVLANVKEFINGLTKGYKIDKHKLYLKTVNEHSHYLFYLQKKSNKIVLSPSKTTFLNIDNRLNIKTISFHNNIIEIDLPDILGLIDVDQSLTIEGLAIDAVEPITSIRVLNFEVLFDLNYPLAIEIKPEGIFISHKHLVLVLNIPNEA